jgi:hypothetical protein
MLELLTDLSELGLAFGQAVHQYAFSLRRGGAGHERSVTGRTVVGRITRGTAAIRGGFDVGIRTVCRDRLFRAARRNLIEFKSFAGDVRRS